MSNEFLGRGALQQEAALEHVERRVMPLSLEHKLEYVSSRCARSLARCCVGRDVCR